jgi:hypothetical protein
MDITYELARKLKTAEFPQTGVRIICPHGYQGYLPNGCQQDECGVSYPTLSELIEACGEMTLMVGVDKSVALNAVNPMHSTVRGEGPTPGEAVASLWLEISTPHRL